MSLLPANDSPWPPEGHSARYDRIRILSAWYSGDRGQLRSVYGTGASRTVGGPATTINPQPGLTTRLIAAIRGEFWGQAPAEGETDTRRHLPLFNDIATLSADWLFSEPIKVRVLGPLWDTDGAPGPDGKPLYRAGDPKPETQAAQARLEHILDRCNFDSLLLAAAEIASALGSTGLRIAFDKNGPIKDRPVITRQDADSLVPIYSWGQLVGVMFWRIVARDAGDEVWRHIEMHEGGNVWHALYKGDSSTIGKRQPLSALPATAPLEGIVDAEGRIVVSPGGVTATNIPNMLPDPMDRGSNAGRSDFTAPVIDLLEAADFIYTQLMDSIDDARSRLFISDSLLNTGKPGEGKSFDSGQRVYARVKVPPAENETGALPIEKVQFEMRVSEYLMGLAAISAMAIRASGYNPDTDGSENAPEMTATEYTGKTRRSMSTRDKKIRYWRTELEQLLTTFAAIDVAEFSPRDPETGLYVKAYPVEVTFPEAVQPSQLELAQVAKALKEAGASMREIFRALHPDWSDTQIQTEIEEALAQASVIDPVSFGTGGQGVGAGDGI